MSADPTRIDLDLDPRHQRMSGVARHGNVPFDVPYITQVHDTLWQGGCETGLVLPTQIVHLVSLYPWERYRVNHQLRSELYVRMYDSLDQSMEQVEQIAAWVEACAEDGPTLVHCQAGLNRSGLVAAKVLVRGGFSGGAAIEHLRRQRSPAVLCNPAFEAYLLNGDPA